MKYKVISFDMFQTLVDVTRRKEIVWKEILGQEYSKENALKGIRGIRKAYDEIHKVIVSEHKFINLEEMYLRAAENMLSKVNFNVSGKKIAHTIMKEHGNAPFYENTLKVLEDLSKNYKIIICSDANHLMIDKIIDKFKFDSVFISDDLLHYKGEPDGEFFKIVLKRLNINASDILHVGDSSSDIIGTKSIGINNCLINRKGSLYDNSCSADNEISCIDEIYKVLDFH